MTEQEKNKPEKRIDFILAVKEENVEYLQIYLANLKILGIESEQARGQSVDLIFNKIHITQDAVVHFAELYDIGIEDPSKGEAIYTERIWEHPWKTPVSTIDRKKDGEVTNAERIMIVNTVLQKAKYGPGDSEYGLAKLMRLKIVETAYPLHDGSLDNADDEGRPHERKLLYIHWSHLSVFYKEQPLDLIRKYFGVEVAFYFAWLEYFNIMLIMPAVLGILPILFGSIALNFQSLDKATVIVKEVCNATDMYICPTCEHRKSCKFSLLSKKCGTAELIHVFDNYLTIFFAVFMSIWAIMFINFWKRKESSLQMRWNCSSDDSETEVRQQYLETATKKRKNRITGETEQYIPFKKKFLKYLFSFGVCILLIGIVVLVVVVLIPFKIWFTWQLEDVPIHFFQKQASNIIMCVAAIIKVIFMKIFAKVYGPASLNLTKIENPRTLQDFDNSVLYKRFFLSFANNFLQMMYLALIKGRFYTIPHQTNAMLQKDICPVLNCLPALCIQIFFIMTCKDLVGNLLSALIPACKRCFHKRKAIYQLTNQQVAVERLPQWEEEYFLEPVGRYFLLSEFMEMVIKYGLITFFAASFSLGPLCALINNTLELRGDAYKLVRSYRRPIPLSKIGIGAWNGILLGMTYASIAMSAFVLCFTSNHLSRFVYYFSNNRRTYEGYVKYIYAPYDTSQYSLFKNVKNHQDKCYVRNFFYPAGHNRYQRSKRYWIDLIARLAGVFIFENVVFGLGALLMYFFPKYPRAVADQLEYEEHQNKLAKMKETAGGKAKSKAESLKTRSMINMNF